MSLALGMVTVGAALIYMAFSNSSLAELVRGEPTEQPADKFAGTDALASDLATDVAGGADAMNAKGVGTFDGKPVAKWIIPWLKKSRQAGWDGSVTSGYRTPAYSEQLCIRMCGEPSCPGRCAGRSSNHSGKVYPHGAVDVSDYTNFARIQRQIGSPLKNALGSSDPVHFSVSGT